MTPEEEHDERESVITAVFVVLAIFAVLCALASSAGADDSAYLRARAAIAINASLVAKSDSLPNVTTGQSIPKPISGSSKPPAKAKPEMWTFYAPFHCPSCEAQKADIKAWKDAPFAFRRGDVNNAPVVIDGYPTTAWKVDGKWWSYGGWHGTEHLEREWKRSLSTKAKPGGQHSSHGTLQSRSLSGITHHTWPGDLRHHLRTTHRITESLTHEQSVMVHDAIHSGYSVTQIRAWARARGMIK